jgi:hypothetical protein
MGLTRSMHVAKKFTNNFSLKSEGKKQLCDLVVDG